MQQEHAAGPYWLDALPLHLPSDSLLVSCSVFYSAVLGFVAAVAAETHGDSLFSQLLAGGFQSAVVVIGLVTLASFAPAVRQVGGWDAFCLACVIVISSAPLQSCGGSTPQPDGWF